MATRSVPNMSAEEKAIIVAGKVRGETDLALSQKIGRSHTTVGRYHNKPAVKALIEHEAAQIMERGLTSARKTLCRLAARGNVKDADKDTLKLALDASKHITSIAGLSGGTPGTVINALINIEGGEKQQEISKIEMFLREKVWGVGSGEEEGRVIDVEPETT